MKKLLMSAAFIALVGSIVPADAGSTLAIGGEHHPEMVKKVVTLNMAASGNHAVGSIKDRE